MASPSAPSRRIAGLDLVRAAAILLAVSSHLCMEGFGIASTRIIHYEILSGIYGVELFFVLSGFLIGGILLRELAGRGTFQAADLLPFWKRRWWRTLPNYLLFLALYYAVQVVWHHVPAPDPWWRYIVFLQNPIPSQPMQPFFAVSWSLAVEEWAYLLLPLCLVLAQWLCRRGGRIVSNPRIAFGALLPLLVLPPLERYFGTYGLAWDLCVRKIVACRLDAIAIGVGEAWLATFRPRQFASLTRPAVVGFAAAVALLLALPVLHYVSDFVRIFHFPIGHVSMDVAYWTVLDIALAIVVAGASTIRTLPAGILRPVLALSLWSYSLYLCHPLIFAIMDTDVLPHFTFAPGMRSLIILVTYPILSIVTAAVLYRMYEHPLTRRRERATGRRERLAALQEIGSYGDPN